jgi:HAD superfamily hydrolase (TIGR01509 family)
MKNDIRAVAFDCDGVMFDTTRANKAYYNHILKQFGRAEMTPDQFRYVHMHTVDESIAYLFPGASERQQAFAYRSQMSYLPFLKYMEIEPDLLPLLSGLRPKYKTAIATNRTDTMNRVLQTHGLTECFDLVVTALDVKRPKPHPDQLDKILAAFNLQPEQVLYIGDSELDARAADAAGVCFIAYANPALRADYHIERLGEVRTILEG